MDVYVDKTKCTGCQHCKDVCPVAVFEMHSRKDMEKANADNAPEERSGRGRSTRLTTREVEGRAGRPQAFCRRKRRRQWRTVGWSSWKRMHTLPGVPDRVRGRMHTHHRRLRSKIRFHLQINIHIPHFSVRSFFRLRLAGIDDNLCGETV